MFSGILKLDKLLFYSKLCLIKWFIFIYAFSPFHYRPFPNIPRLIRHVKEVHLKTSLKTVLPENRNRYFFFFPLLCVFLTMNCIKFCWSNNCIFGFDLLYMFQKQEIWHWWGGGSRILNIWKFLLWTVNICSNYIHMSLNISSYICMKEKHMGIEKTNDYQIWNNHVTD